MSQTLTVVPSAPPPRVPRRGLLR